MGDILRIRDMNEYRVELVDKSGGQQEDHLLAMTSQEAADAIRKEWPGCYIRRITQTMFDWK